MISRNSTDDLCHMFSSFMFIGHSVFVETEMFRSVLSQSPPGRCDVWKCPGQLPHS